MQRVSRFLALALLGSVVLVLLAACSVLRRQPPATPVAPPSAEAEQPPSARGSALLQPEEGGTVALPGGAEVTVPPGALSAPTLATVRTVSPPPGGNAPVPRSLLGPVYELTLEGGSLTGLARIRLPLPPQVTPEEYEIAAYRWNERAWERVTGRLQDGSVQIASANQGLFSLQGRWKRADADLTLTLPAENLAAATLTVPFTVTGQYRFSALPPLQRGFIPARLLLKRDTSGGAGQVTGDVSLDATVTDTPIWFQPDPSQSRGLIQFTHVFNIAPGDLDVTPGTTHRFYAVLQVEDSLAPTRQISTGVQYTPLVPIRAVNTEIVRPSLVNEGARLLRWLVRLDGRPLLEIPADKVTLPLDEVLAKGGIGDYSIVLETQADGKWVVASNEVTVKLAPPPADTPEAIGTPSGGESPSPGELALVSSPTPAGSPPPTPTRRTPPGPGTPEATPEFTPEVTPAATATATATRVPGSDVFWADDYVLVSGDCTLLHWNVQNVTAVYLDGGPVTGVESRRVCPTQSTTYTLRVITGTSAQDWRITINVGSDSAVAIEFSADSYRIAENTCTTLRWRALGVRAVYLDNQGVVGEASQQVCPSTTTVYTLRVVANDGTTTTRTLTIAVGPANTISMRFWADQYTMRPSTCTTLHWSVEGVQAVYVGETGREQGVPGVGSRQACPIGRQSYTMRATTADGRSESLQLTLDGVEPFLGTDEVIAQGVVRSVSRSSDINPTSPGQQPGWGIVVDGINVLFSGPGNCCAVAVMLRVTEALIDGQAIFGVPIDWPINSGQRVEFRAICSASDCYLDAGPPLYLRLRSQ